jgi:hypothetical protein
MQLRNTIIALLVAAASMLSASAAHPTAESDDYVCMAVSPPVDDDGAPGYLNVREKPNAKSKIKIKVQYGSVLIVDISPSMNLFKDWVYTTAAIDGPTTHGWVSKKYLNKLYSCPKPQYMEQDEGRIKPGDIIEGPSK